MIVEFNDQQRQVFCVFSGDGVDQLREHLNKIEAPRRDSMDSRLTDGADTESGQTISGLLQISALNDNDNDVIDFEDWDMEGMWSRLSGMRAACYSFELKMQTSCFRVTPSLRVQDLSSLSFPTYSTINFKAYDLMN